ncbi:26S proteasome non-ATPase regulatory subunit 6 [Lobulomyces angularis]|nr:26S proteasome non-ATPase regulatory subunit 6 [Lobulomyces angularis]
MEVVNKVPNLDLSQSWFLVLNGNAAQKKTALQKLNESIKADHKEQIKSLQEKNDEALAKLEERLVDAETNLGETDISDALIAKAEYLAKIGDKEKAEAAYRVAYEKTGPLGHRIDIVFSLVRIGFFFKDHDLINRNISKAKSLIEEGGDWDRRNRLKSYEGIYKIGNRDFKGGVNLLLDTLATFTSVELMEYKNFVKYAILSGALTLKRPDFKAKVIDAPEILEVIHEIPEYAEFANSLYVCNYSQFFKSLAIIEQHLKYDCYLSPHYQYFVREMRIIAYAQLLESYRSLTIESMANSFGVSEAFIDGDLSKFIAAGRLNAVIDKVGGIVETNRPDSKNAQYQNAIKQGDFLLNRIQKLSRVINV